MTGRLRKKLVEWKKAKEEGDGAAFLFQGVSCMQTMDEEEEVWFRIRNPEAREEAEEEGGVGSL